MSIVTTTEIRRPIKEVFDFLTTPGNWILWHPSTLAVSGATDHSLEVGEQVTEEYVVAGKNGRATWTVRERNAPLHWVFDTIAENGHQATISYSLTSQGDVTLFERTVAITFPPGIPDAVQSEFQRKVGEESTEALRRAKASLENVVR
jgi:uncharacterized protein YndB with AHSA1/START domain